MAIRLESIEPKPSQGKENDDVKIVWQGRRIAKLIFASGKVVEFDEPVEIGSPALQKIDPKNRNDA